MLKPKTWIVWVNVPFPLSAAENALAEGIALYKMSSAVAYLHAALSFVSKESVADVIPAVKMPEGDPLLLLGAVVSGPGELGATLNSIFVLALFAFPSASSHRTKYEYEFPLLKPETVVEWEVVPAPENVLPEGIEENC